MKKAVSTRRFLVLGILSSMALLAFFFGGTQGPISNASVSKSFNFVFLPPSSYDTGDGHVEYGREDYDSSSGKCIIPPLELDSSWIPKSFSPVSCSHHEAKEIVSLVDAGTIHVKESTNTCFYSKVTFVSDFATKTETMQHFLPAGVLPCPADVFHVTCFDAITNSSVFTRLFRCILRRPDIESRLTTTPKSLRKDHIFEERLNILMFGLDSVARVSWLEQMKETTKVFSEYLNGFTFEGYNIVGDGTTAAILGLTTGYMEEELHESRRGFNGASPIDDFPFIWKQLANEASYVTLWDEDGATIGTFHYRLKGFQKPPVDYYGRLFQLTLENKYPRDSCLGATSTFEEMLHQFRYMFNVYPDPIRKFAMIFNSHYSHTSSGMGGQDAYRVDSILAQELKKLHDENLLNQSVVILFADHGSRYDGSRATSRGKISERLPYLSVAFPSWFVKKYSRQMANFRTATKHLTTPFDLHATLLDLGGLDPKPGVPRRGKSFFKPISADRTCEDAGILPHWCTCLAAKESEISLTDNLVKDCLHEFDKYVNNVVLASFIETKQCSHLRSVRPFAARRLSLRNEVAQFVKTIDGHGRTPQFDATAMPANSDSTYIQVSFWTEPGNGQWEVTFSHNSTANLVTVLPKQISRTNRYGTAPHCIQDRYPYLRQFCYCQTQAEGS